MCKFSDCHRASAYYIHHVATSVTFLFTTANWIISIYHTILRHYVSHTQLDCYHWPIGCWRWSPRHIFNLRKGWWKRILGSYSPTSSQNVINFLSRTTNLWVQCSKSENSFGEYFRIRSQILRRRLSKVRWIRIQVMTFKLKSKLCDQVLTTVITSKPFPIRKKQTLEKA